MKIERMEILGVIVPNLEEAIKWWSDALGTTFTNLGEVKVERNITEHANKAIEKTQRKVAIDRTGYIELIEMTPPMEKFGVYCIHFKVPNIEEAKAEMAQKGLRLISDIKIGGVKEAIFSPEDTSLGIRLNLLEYKASTLVDAIMQR